MHINKINWNIVLFVCFPISEIPGMAPSMGGSEISSYEIELQNRVTQNDVALPFTNLKMFIDILLSSY